MEHLYRRGRGALARAVAALLLTVLTGAVCQGATLFESSLSLLKARSEKTSPADYRFVLLGDSRDNEKMFRKVLSAAASYNPLFIVHGGDYADRGSAVQTAHFLEVLREAVPQIPFFVVLGNHENEAVFAREVGPSHFTLDNEHLGLTFVAVNNAEYKLRPAERGYLGDKVSHCRRACFVMMHIPPKTERWSWHAFSDGAEELRGILAGGKVQAAFFSHVHLFDEDRFGGVPAFITGGGGAPLLRHGFPGKAVYHFLLVEVKGGKSTVTKVEVPES